MGDIRHVLPVTPIVAALYGHEADWLTARAGLLEYFGPIALESEPFEFTFTAYYTPSMGPNLIRRFVAFERMSDPVALADWKLFTNALEAKVAASLPNHPVARPVNLDAGYLTAAKLVLASTKDFAHRIYLRDGMFAEITLSYKGSQWTAHTYTFPDYRSGVYDGFLIKARDLHMRHRK